MKSGYYAGIDIGTNGARLVIKDAFYNEERKLEAVEVNKVSSTFFMYFFFSRFNEYI